MILCLGWGQLLPGRGEEWLDQQWAKMEFPSGAACVLVQGGQILKLRGFGFLENEGKVNVDSETVFRVGSLGKPVVAMGILALVQAGDLALTDKVDDLLPGILMADGHNWYREVEVQHLLEHSSGLDDMHFNEYHVAQSLDLMEAMAFNPGSKRIRWRPGSRSSYSNLGYAMLAAIGARVSGLNWKQWLQSSVFEPLQMEHSGFGEIKFSNRAWGHERGLKMEAEVRYRYEPSLSFYTTAEDMGKLLMSWLGITDTVLNRNSMQRMEAMQATLAGQLGIQEGYTAGLQTSWNKAWQCFYHTGKIEGYSAIFEYYPKQNRGFAVLYNSVTPSTARNAPLTNALRGLCLLHRREVPAAPIVLRSSPQNPHLDQQGWYQLRNPRNQVFAWLDAWRSQVEVRVLDSVRLMIGQDLFFALGNGKLVAPGQLHCGAVLSEQQGQAFLQIGKQYFEPVGWQGWWLAQGFLLLQLGLSLGLLGLGLWRTWQKQGFYWGFAWQSAWLGLAWSGFWLLTESGVSALAEVGVVSLALAGLSWSLGLLVLAGGWSLWRVWGRREPGFGVFLLLWGMNLGLSFVLFLQGFLPFQSWS